MKYGSTGVCGYEECKRVSGFRMYLLTSSLVHVISWYLWAARFGHIITGTLLYFVMTVRMTMSVACPKKAAEEGCRSKSEANHYHLAVLFLPPDDLAT